MLTLLLAGGEDEPSAALSEMASGGPDGWHRDPPKARRQVEALKAGFDLHRRRK